MLLTLEEIDADILSASLLWFKESTFSLEYYRYLLANTLDYNLGNLPWEPTGVSAMFIVHAMLETAAKELGKTAEELIGELLHE